MGNSNSSNDSAGTDLSKFGFVTAVQATREKEYYIEQAHLYFDLIAGTKDRSLTQLFYSNWLIRYEWEPWLMLTAQNNGVDTAKLIDSLEPEAIPCEVPMEQRYVRFYTTNPFVRMMIRIYWPDRTSDIVTWIYEEFSFDRNNDICFIEAWSYPESTLSRGGGKGYVIENQNDPLLPSDKAIPSDLTDEESNFCWPDQDRIYRMATHVPGLGDADCKPKILKEGQDSFLESLTELNPEIEDAIQYDSNPEFLRAFVEKYRTDFAVQYSKEFDKVKQDPTRLYYNQCLGNDKKVKHHWNLIPPEAKLKAEVHQLFNI